MAIITPFPLSTVPADEPEYHNANGTIPLSYEAFKKAMQAMGITDGVKGASPRFYDEPFPSRKLSTSLAAGLREVTRKKQLFEQVNLYLSAQRQAQRMSGLLAYVGKNHTPAARAGALP